MSQLINRVTKSASFALVALPALGSAQQVDGSNGVNMNATGQISNAPHITFPSQTNGGVLWTNPLLSGYVPPAGQLTGVARNGTAVAYLDLIPLKTSSVTVVNSSNNPTVILDGSGITTHALNIVDSTTGLPVAVGVDNGTLTVAGSPVSGGSGSVDFTPDYIVTNGDQFSDLTQNTVILGGNPFVFNTHVNKGITADTGGNYHLKGGNTYRLEAAICSAVSNVVQYQWKDAGGNPISWFAKAADPATGQIFQPAVVTFYTPAIDTTVSLRATNSCNFFAGHSYISITQINTKTP